MKNTENKNLKQVELNLNSIKEDKAKPEVKDKPLKADDNENIIINMNGITE